MPLVTEIIGVKGEVLEIPWTYFHLSCMYTAAIKDAAPHRRVNDEMTYGEIPEGKYVDFSMAPIYYLDMPDVPLVSSGRQKLKNDYRFDGPKEGESFLLKKGYILRAWREMK